VKQPIVWLAKGIELLLEEGAADWRDIRTKAQQEPVQVCKFCQGQNGGGWRSKVIDKSILWNRVVYYVRGEYYLALVRTPRKDSSRR